LLERILRLYPERVEIKKRWAVVTWANYFAQAAARRDFVGFGDDAVIGFLNQESAELTAPGRGPLPSPSRPHEDVLNVFVTRHAIDSCCETPAALVLDRKKLAAFSAAAGRFLRFPIGDRRCNRMRASVSNAGGKARPSLTNARQL